MCYGRLRTQSNNKNTKKEEESNNNGTWYSTQIYINWESILYNSLCLEDYMSRGNTSNDPDLPDEVDAIFQELEGVVDKYYAKIEKAKSKQPTPDWED